MWKVLLKALEYLKERSNIILKGIGRMNYEFNFGGFANFRSNYITTGRRAFNSNKNWNRYNIAA